MALGLIVFSFIEIPTGFFRTKISLLLAGDNSLIMDLSVYPEGTAVFCADGATPLILEVQLCDSGQNPVPYSRIKLQFNHFSARMKPARPITGRDGRVTITLFPQEPYRTEAGAGLEPVTEASASIRLSAAKASPVLWEGKIASPPVLLVHGFQDTSESMVPLKNFLTGKGLLAFTLDYDTNTDLPAMSIELEKALSGLMQDLKSKGIHAQRADIVAHSLGGLVARYYTTQPAYLQTNNVHKIVFINVPHHGTPWAEAGADVLNSPFLAELYPTSALYTSVFPSFINKGLNQTIQTANIALENDEVVPIPSSLLASWDIETKVYRIGSEPLTLETVIGNQITGSSRHRQLLFYTPIFEEIYHDLTRYLSYPQKRK